MPTWPRHCVRCRVGACFGARQCLKLRYSGQVCVESVTTLWAALTCLSHTRPHLRISSETIVILHDAVILAFQTFFFVNVRYGHVAAFTWRITSPSCLLHHYTQVKTVRRTDYCVSSQYLMSSFSYMYIFFPWATDLYEYTCRMWRQTRLAAGTGYVDAHALPLSAALAWVSYPCYQYMLKKKYSRI